MTYQLCVASHRDNPPSALGGLKLCAGHHAGLTEALTGPSAAEDPTVDAVWGVLDDRGLIVITTRDKACAQVGGRTVCGGDGTNWWPPQNYRPGGLVRDYTALTLRMTGLSTGDKMPYVVHSAEVPLPVPDAVAELRSQIRHDLIYWVGCHARTADAARAPISGTEPAQLAAWLAGWRDWAAAQDWAGDYVDVLSELRARARRLIDLPRAPRVPVAPCPEHGCDGTLWSAIREEYDPRPSKVQCDACGAEWDSTQWMRLGQRLAAKAGRAA